MTTESSTLNSDPITQLKGIAIFLVVWWHLHQPFLQVNILGYEAGWLLGGSGRLGVWIFFIVSGYLIGKSFFHNKYPLTPGGIFAYFLNRFLSVVPYFLLTILVLFFLYNGSDKMIIVNLKDELLLRGNIHIQEHDIGYLWFISTLVKLYIIAPVFFLVIRLLARLKKFRVPAFVLLFDLVFLLIIREYAIYSKVYVDPYSKFYYAGVIPNLGLFLFGFVINAFFLQIKSKKIFFIISSHIAFLKKIFILLFLGLYLSVGFVTHDMLANFFNYSLLFMLILPFLTCLTVFYYILLYKTETHTTKTVGKFSHLKNWKLPLQYVLGIIGTYSYLIYLIHLPFADKVKQECVATCSLTELSIKFVITMGFSILFSFFVDNTVGKVIRKAKSYLRPDSFLLFLTYLPVLFEFLYL